VSRRFVRIGFAFLRGPRTRPASFRFSRFVEIYGSDSILLLIARCAHRRAGRRYSRCPISCSSPYALLPSVAQVPAPLPDPPSLSLSNSFFSFLGRAASTIPEMTFYSWRQRLPADIYLNLSWKYECARFFTISGKYSYSTWGMEQTVLWLLRGWSENKIKSYILHPVIHSHMHTWTRCLLRKIATSLYWRSIDFSVFAILKSATFSAHVWCLLL